MKKVLFFLFSIICLNAKAQQYVTCVENNQCLLAKVFLFSSSDFKEYISFVKFDHVDGAAFNFGWLHDEHVISLDDLLRRDKDSSLQKSTIIIKLDNDSLITIKSTPELSGVSTAINNHDSAYFLTINANMSDKQMQAFKYHKLVSIALTTNDNVTYQLFKLSDKNKNSILEAASCFIDNLNKHE